MARNEEAKTLIDIHGISMVSYLQVQTERLSLDSL